jgi:hypothetical protein
MSSFRYIAIILFFIFSFPLQSKNVLFLGNSYTFYNNLPEIVANLTESTGKTIDYTSISPGGATLQGHWSDPVTMNAIRQGNWDIVILQEQSQIPTIDYYRYGSMYPAAVFLSDSIRKYNKCATIMTYMTWGRQYGGRQCDPTNEHCSPDFIDFNHMQDSLESAYVEISEIIGAVVSPVGIAWKKALENDDVVLHSGDQSHPNYEGSFLSACVLFGSICNESPLNITDNLSLSEEKAQYFKEIANEVLFEDSELWNMHLNYPIANFTYSIAEDTIHFENKSLGVEELEYFWDFGDGNISYEKNPAHRYTEEGNYEVILIVNQCNKRDTSKTVIDMSVLSIDGNNSNELTIFPNPVEIGNIINIGLFKEKILKLQITDVYGNVNLITPVKNHLENYYHRIAPSDFTSGIYIMKIYTNSDIISRKLIVL